MGTTDTAVARVEREVFYYSRLDGEETGLYGMAGVAVASRVRPFDRRAWMVPYPSYQLRAEGFGSGTERRTANAGG